MTTVAVKDGLMAADTRMTERDIVISDSFTKIQVVGEWAVGGAGDIFSYTNAVKEIYSVLKADLPLEEWVDAYPLSHNSRSFNLLLSHPEQGIWEYDGVFVKVGFDFHAVGSGADFAKGAMSWGATADAAVGVAMKFDVHTGGKIESVKHGA